MALKTKLNGNMVYRAYCHAFTNTHAHSHISDMSADLSEPHTQTHVRTTVERVNTGYKGNNNNIQLQCQHIKEIRWKNSKKYKKIHRIKSEDIVADIKDTILHCQLFKVLPCV